MEQLDDVNWLTSVLDDDPLPPPGTGMQGNNGVKQSMPGAGGRSNSNYDLDFGPMDHGFNGQNNHGTGANSFHRPNSSNMVPMKRTKSETSNMSIGSFYGGPDTGLNELVDKFRYIRRKRRLNLQKVSDLLGVSKAELSKFNGGKDPNWQHRQLLENWLYSSENLEALKGYTGSQSKSTQNDPRAAQFSGTSSSSMLKSENNNSMPHSSAASTGRSYSPNYASSQLNHPPTQAYHPPQAPIHSQHSMRQHSFHSPAAAQRPPSSYRMEAGDGSNYRQPNQARPSYPSSSYSMPASNVGPPPVVKPEIPNATSQSQSRGFLDQQDSITLLSQLLKRETNDLLHKGIDSAIGDYLEMSRRLKPKNGLEASDNEQKYVYKNNTKLLMNRLSTICGNEVVQRAISYLFSRKSNSGSSNVGSMTPGYSKSSQGQRTPSAPVGSNSGIRPSSRSGDYEAQSMAHLTRVWNHACRCRDEKCTYPTCLKIRPAVSHQVRLKNQKQKCTTKNCEHCQLYNKLYSFSAASRGQGNTPATPSKSAQPSFNAQGRQPSQPAKNSAASGYPPYYANSSAPTNQMSSSRSGTPGSMYYGSQGQYGGVSTPTNAQQGGRASSSLSLGPAAIPVNNSRPEYQSHPQKAAASGQGYGHMNVNYNTYNINAHPGTRSNPPLQREADRALARSNPKKPSFSSRSDDDGMAAVADMLDERKHNLNINVNVNINPRNNPNMNHVHERYGNNSARDNSTSRAATSSPSGKRKPQSQMNMYEPMTTKKHKDAASSSAGIPSSYSAPSQNQNQRQEVPRPNVPPPSSHPGFNQVYNDDLDDGLEELLKDESDLNEANATDNGAAGRRLLCAICQIKDVDVVFNPCKHCCACAQCSQRLSTCPICRSQVASTSFIYLS